MNNLDKLSCPFRDDKNKKCQIYEVRPYICRVFKCDQRDKPWLHDKNQYNKRIVSMTQTFFKKW